MTTPLRALNADGLRQFSEYIDGLNRGSTTPIPMQLLQNDETSEEIDTEATVESRQFSSKIEAAKYLKDALSTVSPLMLDRNQGVWGWLSLFYFNQLCPESASGTRKPGQQYRFLLSGDWKHRYRHLLAGPYTLYVHHGDAARTILERPVTKHGDFAEQLTSRYEIVRNHELVKAVDTLYWDVSAAAPKRGATNRRRRGSLRRLISIVGQFEVTYDLFSMKSEEILALLPSEFEPWGATS